MMPEISFLIVVVLDAGKNLARNNLFKSSQLVMDLGAR